MIVLQIEIVKKSNDDLDLILKKAAIAMKEKFDKYWGDWMKINPLVFVANALDPRNKFQMLVLKKLGGTTEKVKEVINQVKKDLVTLWAEYNKGANGSLMSGKPSMECGNEDDTGEGGTGYYDELFNHVEEHNEKEQLQQISNEVDKYLADEVEKRSNTTFNLLTWWKRSETKYPILSLIAKDIFAIPSSKVASESAFSLGKRVVDPFRN